MTINRYKKANIPVHRSLRVYGGDMETINAFKAMQKTGLLVVDYLLNQPDGAYAVIHGFAHWVSPIYDELVLFSTPCGYESIEFSFKTQEANNNIVITTPWDVDGLDAKTSKAHQNAMEVWLESPVYCFADQDFLDRIALTDYDDDVIQETQVLSLSVKNAIHESAALGGLIYGDDKNADDLVF